jgi:hypothetical protein
MPDLEKVQTINARISIKKASGKEAERDLTFLAVPRVGETLLIPGIGLTGGYKAVVTEVIHQPATKGFGPEIYLMAQSEDY